MPIITATKNSFTVKAYAGDNKTLLAFNFSDKARAKNLAGFSIACLPPGGQPYYLWNELQFEDPSKHAQVAAEKPNSSVNAPIQKFRWTHVPGSVHQGTSPATGIYKYTVTPRYFDSNQSMQKLDETLSVMVNVNVGPFRKGALSLGFTRGYMQSEAFVRHFGNSRIQPANRPLVFDTTTKAGDLQGQSFTYADIYNWMGSTGRARVFDVLNAVVADKTLHLDVFAYDLNEPDVCKIFLQLAGEGRIKIILDSASLHVTAKGAKTPTMEDALTTEFRKQAKAPAEILRGCFDRFSHDKIFIVSKNGNPIRVLTGSTNFSVTGLYVNANHVLVFDDATVVAQYAKVFAESWKDLQGHPKVSRPAAAAFAASALAMKPFSFKSASVPKLSITFSPHTTGDVTNILGGIASRINAEKTAAKGSVLFAVMQLTGSQTPVYQTLSALHAGTTVFSYGISDAPQGVFLYQPGSKDGVMVTGKPSQVILPPPFDQVPSPPGHEIHDKFVVCGLNGSDPVVYCGSSNLASGGEAANGDNLLEIHDAEVATAFAIEALLLVDHYNFLDRWAAAKKTKASTVAKKTAPQAAKTKSAGVGGMSKRVNAKSAAKATAKTNTVTKKKANAVVKKKITTAKKKVMKRPLTKHARAGK
jgi:hypothetical protein